jgi:plasmid stabilization system protein ParE
MHLNVIFTDEANDTFESIGEQIRAKWGDKELNEFRKRTYKVVETISKFPLVFQAAGKTESVRKAFIHKNCSMLYEIKSDRIEILFFWDNRQEPIF